MGRKNNTNIKLTSTKNQPNPTFQKQQLELHETVDKLLRITTTTQETNIIKTLLLQKQIKLLVEKIQKLEFDKNTKNSNNNNNRTSQKVIDKFIEWAKENGAEFDDCCKIKEFEGYELGLEASKDVSESDIIITVPKKMMLTIEAANQSDLYKLIENDQILKFMPNVALSIFLLYEKFRGNSSFWKPYIDILPKSYSTILYFTVEELEQLKGSPTLDIALKQIKNVARQYAYFYKLFSSRMDPVCKLFKTRFTYNEYCWAVSTVMTRQNSIPISDGFDKNYALIPLWDLCNHTNGVITTCYNTIKEQSECLALKNFQAGEQLFIFYGPRSNAELFIHNGFIIEDNEYDNYWIHLGISKSDPLQSQRLELLKKLNLSTTNDFFIKKIQKNHKFNEQLLAFLRIFNMNEEQLQFWSTTTNDKLNDLKQIECVEIDKSLDKKSWLYLQTRLKLILANYKTTIEDDLELINNKQNELSSNKILAIKMRTTEKRMIKDIIMYIEQYI